MAFLATSHISKLDRPSLPVGGLPNSSPPVGPIFQLCRLQKIWRTGFVASANRFRPCFCLGWRLSHERTIRQTQDLPAPWNLKGLSFDSVYVLFSNLSQPSSFEISSAACLTILPNPSFRSRLIRKVGPAIPITPAIFFE